MNIWASANGGKKGASTATTTLSHLIDVLSKDVVQEAQAHQQLLKRRLHECDDEGNKEKGGRLPSKVEA
jgi:hypothetical protein